MAVKKRATSSRRPKRMAKKPVVTRDSRMLKCGGKLKKK